MIQTQRTYRIKKGQMLIRVPKMKYEQAYEVQQRIMKEQQIKIPLWECLIKAEQNEKEMRGYDPLRRLRL